MLWPEHRLGHLNELRSTNRLVAAHRHFFRLPPAQSYGGLSLGIAPLRPLRNPPVAFAENLRRIGTL
ncbi:hypothetical protein FHS92_001048 [Sphingobium subterraneum]|uniref:Uncharacterized protein n=1 Tax=Sphingobium subterraneum TaxID=627688 RepID=A0A841J537_9SPHN|nr:hypothetical protein [Sphingobium subterraneum]